MRGKLRVLAGAAGVSVLAALVPGVWSVEAGAAESSRPPADAVFVQTDNLDGNQIVAYARASNGSLSWDATYATGGLGGQLNGSAVDFLASQGSLTYDPAVNLLIAVNAGSDTISVFSVDGKTLTLRQVLPSGGSFPNSVAVSGRLVYVLNARDGGSLQGYRVTGSARLNPIPGSRRPLGLTTPTDKTEFTNTPGQVAFTPDGSQLLVTTKATTSSIDVFSLLPSGRLSPSPTVNSEPGAVPFAVTYDQAGRVVIANAGTNSLSTYSLGPDGTLVAIATEPTGQSATCWVSGAEGYLFASNAGSGSLSTFAESTVGNLSSPTTTAADAGTVDSSLTTDGDYLYVQGGLSGTVHAFAVGPGGTLTSLGSVTVPDAAGGEGIVAF